MLNQVTLMGRLVRDPELKYTQNGIEVLSFTLAVERDYKNNSVKETDFIDCTAWRQTARLMADYCTKGRLVTIAGRLEVRTWQDKDGNNRKKAEVVADRVYFCDSRKDADGQQAQARPQGQQQIPDVANAQAYDQEIMFDEGDIPF